MRIDPGQATQASSPLTPAHNSGLISLSLR
jgi:hypothetical protein